MRPVLALWILATSGLAAQGLPPEVLMLSRIRARVQEAVGRLPDCTCLETVARTVKPAGKKPNPLDTVVMQILFSGGREMFASPGETQWESSPMAFVASGMIADGLFALHLRAVFLNNESVIQYHGMESWGGHPAARYDYSIAQIRSGYTLTNGGASDVVASAGSFWADPQTHDLDRLEFHAVDIPPEMHYTDVLTAITYNRVRVGEIDVLLPQTADLRTVAVDGTENRDMVEFTHCHGFGAESTVRFGAEGIAPPAPATATGPPAGEEPLPAQLRIPVALTTPIDDRSAVGSAVQGKVVGRVMLKRKVVVPDGAPVQGRIRRLERHKDSGVYFIVAIEFTRVEAPDQNFRFYADLLDLDRREGVEMTFHTLRTESRVLGLNPTDSAGTRRIEVQVWTHDVPGVGTFFIHGGHFTLPPGFQTVWMTRLFPQARSR